MERGPPKTRYSENFRAFFLAVAQYSQVNWKQDTTTSICFPCHRSQIILPLWGRQARVPAAKLKAQGACDCLAARSKPTWPARTVPVAGLSPAGIAVRSADARAVGTGFLIVPAMLLTNSFIHLIGDAV